MHYLCVTKKERAEFSIIEAFLWRKPNYTYVVKCTNKCYILEILISRNKVKIIACTIVIILS